VLAAASGPVAHAQEQPYRQNDAGGFRNVLPGGQGETVNALELAAAQGGSAPASYTDQLPMYTELLKAEPTLTAADLDKFFKDTSFGAKPEDVVRTARPRAGVAILRDRYNVPHVYGQTRADTMFGAGYASAEDRLFLMDVLRHTGRGRLTELIGAGTNDANVVAARPGRPGQGDGERRDDRRPRSGGLPAAAARDRPDPARGRRAGPEDARLLARRWRLSA